MYVTNSLQISAILCISLQKLMSQYLQKCFNFNLNWNWKPLKQGKTFNTQNDY